MQERLVHVVLVLADTQGFRVDLHQLGERVHQAAADGNRAANRHVLVRELFPGDVGRGVHGSAILAHGEDPDAVREAHLADELLRLAAGRTVADGDDLDPILLHQVRDRHDGLDLLRGRRMRKDDRMVQQAAVLVQADDLAARPEARVDGHRPLLPHRGGEQQLPEVLAEDADGIHVGLELRLLQDFVRDGRLQETLVGVIDGSADFQPALPGRIAFLLAVVVVHLVSTLFGVGVDGQLQEALVLRP